MEVLSAVGRLLIAAGIAGFLIRFGGFFSPRAGETAPRTEPGGLGELVDRALQVISSYPEGVTLVEIGEELGIDWRQLIAPVNRLLAERRVEKRGKSYFVR